MAFFKIFFIGFLVAFILITIIFVRSYSAEKNKLKQEKQKAQEQKIKYKEELKHNEEILNNINTTNAVSKLHDLAKKGESRIKRN